ncbi:hypothetical protein ACQKKX_04820 [Neorhizobium sp. NPDC001467]
MIDDRIEEVEDRRRLSGKFDDLAVTSDLTANPVHLAVAARLRSNVKPMF